MKERVKGLINHPKTGWKVSSVKKWLKHWVLFLSDVNQQVTHHAPLRRMPSFNPTNPPTSLPPSTASVSDWLKSNDAHLIQGPGRPRSGLSEHPPLSPQSSTASSGSGSDTHVEDVQHHSVRNTFMEEGSGMRGK